MTTAVLSSERGRISCGESSEQAGSCVEENGNLGDELLENFDSYWDDIKDWLMVSRMVSDSVIKGMVTAVEQNSAEEIAAKELELTSLRKSLHAQTSGTNRIELINSPLVYNELHRVKCGAYLSILDAFMDHDRVRESFDTLKIAAREQFNKLKNEIDVMRGRNSMRKIGSGSEQLGLGGILKERESENWIGIDGSLDALKISLNSLCMQVDDMLQLSQSYLLGRQLEYEFQEKVGVMVIQSYIGSLFEEFDEKQLDQKASHNYSQSMNWLDKMNEVSSLCKELHEMLKSLRICENGQTITHGSHDMNLSHENRFSNHVTSTTLICDENGNLEESKTDVPLNFDANQLKHLSNDDMAKNFNSIFTKLRRHHDSQMQNQVDKYYELRREYLNYRSGTPPMPLKKDLEFDVLRKKIPQVISKLDAILVGKVPAFGNNVESLSILKNRVDCLLSENHQLKNSLEDKKNEVDSLTVQISNAANKQLQQSLEEAKLLKLVENLHLAMDDITIQGSIRAEVYKSVLRELSSEVKSGNEDSELELEHVMMQDVYETILSEAIHDHKMASKHTHENEFEQSAMLPMIVQDLCYVIFKQTVTDAKQKFKDLYSSYSAEIKNRLYLENKLLEKDNEVQLQAGENQKLKKEVFSLEMLVKEKEKLVMDESAALTKERANIELVSQELSDLKDHAFQLQRLNLENCIELCLTKSSLKDALEQIEVDKMEVDELKLSVERVMLELGESNKEKCRFFSLARKRENDLLLAEVREQKFRTQIKSLIVLSHTLSKIVTDFESKVYKDIKSCNLRLEHSSSEMNSLMKEAKMLRRRGFLDKQRLERRFSDLQMAEAEVDLLGDEVDTLLSLLEKIYVALDHYSPILQHYPGVIEVLKLVRRELIGESTKAT